MQNNHKDSQSSKKYLAYSAGALTALLLAGKACETDSSHEIQSQSVPSISPKERQQSDANLYDTLKTQSAVRAEVNGTIAIPKINGIDFNRPTFHDIEAAEALVTMNDMLIDCTEDLAGSTMVEHKLANQENAGRDEFTLQCDPGGENMTCQITETFNDGYGVSNFDQVLGEMKIRGQHEIIVHCFPPLNSHPFIATQLIMRASDHETANYGHMLSKSFTFLQEGTYFRSRGDDLILYPSSSEEATLELLTPPDEIANHELIETIKIIIGQDSTIGEFHVSEY